MCGPHHTRGGNEKCGFLNLASKPVEMVCQWVGLKTTAIVSWFGPQSQGRQFGALGLKITAMIFWFGPQNKGEKVYQFAPKK
jgi:hypothetical protein